MRPLEVMGRIGQTVRACFYSPEKLIVPSIQKPQRVRRVPRALPSRFKRQRVLIVGCGDVGQRVARLWRPMERRISMELPGGAQSISADVPDLIAEKGAQPHHRLSLVRALTSSPEKCAALRARGILPLQGNLDDAASLRRLAGLAQRVVHLAPPAAIASVEGETAASVQDRRTRHLLRALVRRAHSAPALVYGSTSGVYGDWQGAWVDEAMPLRATTARALRRVDAESQLRSWALRFQDSGARVHVLRIPGIYAGDREGGTPVARLLRGTPALRAEDDVFTSHIHADDLARAVALALWRGKPQRTTNVADDSILRMGDYFDLAADLWQLPRPPRISRAEAVQQLSPVLLSFMSESRRIANRRMKMELGLRLRYPTVQQGLAAAYLLSKDLPKK